MEIARHRLYSVSYPAPMIILYYFFPVFNTLKKNKQFFNNVAEHTKFPAKMPVLY
jgi:hypothetical protein